MIDLSSAAQRLKSAIKNMNEYGIPLPLLRINGVPTFTGTMTFLAFNTCLFGQIGKLTQLTGPLDLSQANYLFLTTVGVYLGRRMQSNSAAKTATIDEASNAAK